MSSVPLPAQLAERTVPELLQRDTRHRGDADALIALSAYDGERRVSYAELSELAGRLGAALLDRRVGHGDRVGILFDNEAALEAHLAYHAAHRIGAINVPLNNRFVARELDIVVRKAGVTALVFGSEFATSVRQLGPLLDSIALLEAGPTPVLGENLRTAYLDLAEAEQVELSEHDDADWIFTSGTTGNPKAVALTHGNSVACGYQSQHLWGVDAWSVYQSSAPFFTSTGSHTNLLACLAAGCTYAIEPDFDVRETLARIGRYRSTSVFIVSGMLQLMLDRVGLDELDHVDLSSLRRLCYGGQAMPAPFYRRVHEVFHDRYGIELVHLYGLTEGGTSGLMLPPDRHAEAVGRAGQHGLSIGDRGFNEWIDWRVVDSAGNDTAPDAVGEILLRAPSVMDRYVDEAEATAAVLRDGWLHTGDMGSVDESGLVYFVDRRQQMIRRGGLNISSAEVEGILAQHPAVVEVAVIPRPSPILGQEPCAIVVLKAGHEVAEEALTEHCSQHLADYKIPVAYAFVDQLPRNAMGRVVKSGLAERL